MLYPHKDHFSWCHSGDKTSVNSSMAARMFSKPSWRNDRLLGIPGPDHSQWWRNVRHDVENLMSTGCTQNPCVSGGRIPPTHKLPTRLCRQLPLRPSVEGSRCQISASAFTKPERKQVNLNPKWQGVTAAWCDLQTSRWCSNVPKWCLSVLGNSQYCRTGPASYLNIGKLSLPLNSLLIRNNQLMIIYSPTKMWLKWKIIKV